MKFYLLLLLALLAVSSAAAPYKLARLHYSGGGDWYNDPEVLPNLARFFNQQTGKTVFDLEQAIVRADSPELSQYPFVYLTGHGNINLNSAQLNGLRNWLLAGGFLYVDDDYGLDKHWRKELKRLLPEYELTELPASHGLFNCWFKFPRGVPKIHEHDKKRPQAFGVFNQQGRLMVLYTYETNISDGWADERTHNDPFALRQTALQMGFNVLWWALSQ